MHKKCTSLVQNIQHLNVKQIVHGLLISGKTPFFRPVFCKICSFFYKKENINNINKIKSFLLEQIYSILVSGFLSYNQFKVSQFLESKKETVMFSGSVEVWDCIGEACAGHLQGLWDMKQAPSGIPSSSMGLLPVLRVSLKLAPLYWNTLKLQSFLGLPGPVCNVAHSALAPGGSPSNQGLITLLFWEFFRPVKRNLQQSGAPHQSASVSVL